MSCNHVWRITDDDDDEYRLSICEKCGSFLQEDFFLDEVTIEPGYEPHSYQNHVRNDERADFTEGIFGSSDDIGA